MAIEAYDQGDVIRCSGEFRTSLAVLTDPSEVRFELAAPHAVPVTYVYGTDTELKKDSTGAYHLDVNADTPGLYRWRIYSTGTGKAAGTGEFLVKSW